MQLDVRLRESDHVYLDSKNKIYQSTTTLIGNFKEKFDPFKIMKNGKTLIDNYVEKHGHSREYWFAQWDLTKELACASGTAFHKLKEDKALFSKYFKTSGKTRKIQHFDKIVEANPGISYYDLPDGVYPELTIFNRRYMVAGQADRVIKEGEEFDIEDFKTNKKFDKVSFRHPRHGFKMMKHPANKLMDCHLGHYTLQLNIYAWYLAEFGLRPRNLSILYYYLSPEERHALLQGWDIGNKEPERINVPVNLQLAKGIIMHNNYYFRKSKRSDMYLI